LFFSLLLFFSIGGFIVIKENNIFKNTFFEDKVSDGIKGFFLFISQKDASLVAF